MTNRAHLTRTVQDAAGNVLTEATVFVYEPGTFDLIAETIYSDDTSSAELANPFLVSSGAIDFYLTLPKRVRLQVSIPSQEPRYFEDVDVTAPASFVDSVTLRAPNGTDFWVLSVQNDGTLQVVNGATTHTFVPTT